MGATYIRKLPIPMEIKKQYPLTEELAKIKKQRDKEISDVFLGKSDKFIVISEISVDLEPYINENGFFMHFNNIKNVSKYC